MCMTEIQLKVVEAIQEDVNKGLIRIDKSFMDDIGVYPGDYVSITGARTTVAQIERSLPGDIGLTIIRMDGLTRRNAGARIGEYVAIKKADTQPAQHVVIAPAREGIKIRVDNPELLNRFLLGRVMQKGDVISLGTHQFQFAFGDLKFVVAETIPKKQPVVVRSSSTIECLSEAVELKDEPTIPEVSYEDIGGLSDELHKIREMIELPLRHPELFDRLGIEPPKGVLLHGPPGTGKTLLAKAVANETNSNFYVINGPEIMSKFYGQSEENLRKIFEEAEKNAPSIIFIDEIDAIAPKREESKGEVERRVVAQLLTIMDGLATRGKVVVMAATNIPNSIDPALRRPGRFDRELELGAPDIKGRENILKIHTRNMPLGEKVDLKVLAQLTHGFVGADLASLVKEAAMNVLRKLLPELKIKDDDAVIPPEILDKIVIAQRDLIDALKVVRPSAMREVLIETPNVKWSDVGGLQDIKQELIEAVEWPLKYKPVFKRLGVRPPKGVLIYGPPGTGKTLLAKAVAKETEANFIAIKGPELLSKWVGESEKAVREIFKKARQVSPAIIFIDEIDSLAPSRTAQGDSNHVSEKVVNQLLTEMDGLQELNDVVVIAATNRPDVMDTALLRPGRFDRIILAGVPDTKSREEIFRVHTKKMPLAKNVSLKELVEKTEGYVGADIEAVCREAAMFELRKNIKTKQVSNKSFEQALQKVRPSASKEIQEAYAMLQNQFSAARGKEFKEERPNYYG